MQQILPLTSQNNCYEIYLYCDFAFVTKNLLPEDISNTKDKLLWEYTHHISKLRTGWFHFNVFLSYRF